MSCIDYFSKMFSMYTRIKSEQCSTLNNLLALFAKLLVLQNNRETINYLI